MIPYAIRNFCRELYTSTQKKFPQRSEGIVAEFVFERWLLKALCDDGNQSGLVTN